MFDRSGSLFARLRLRRFAPSAKQTMAMVVALSLQWLAAGPAWPQANLAPSTSPTPSTASPAPAQPGAPDPSVPPAEATPPPPREENPGLLNELGKLLDKSREALPTLKTPSEAIEGLTTPSSMVTGRVACPISANGAPDCKAAAAKLCQSKNYKDGKSLNVDFAEKCSPKIYIPGHKREPGDCRADNYVTRALCQ